MKVLSSNIKIGKYTFNYVHEVFIETNFESLTNTGLIKLPKNLKFQKGQMKTEIKKGDEVIIQIGYDGQLNTVFEGFVSRLKTTVPVEIELEDLMWKLKQIEVNDVAKNETLKSFLERNIPYKIDCFDIELPRFVASKITAAKLLDLVKEQTGLYTFIRDNTVVVGKQYDAQNYKSHKILLDYNVEIENLEYMIKDDLKLKVTAISNMENGEKIEVELGDPEGEERTLNFYNLKKEDLTKIAEKELDKLKYDGYRGSITIFGEPLVKHGDVVELLDKEESDRRGNYFVDAVNYSHGVNGYRQELTLGKRT